MKDSKPPKKDDKRPIDEASSAPNKKDSNPGKSAAKAPKETKNMPNKWASKPSQRKAFEKSEREPKKYPADPKNKPVDYKKSEASSKGEKKIEKADQEQPKKWDKNDPNRPKFKKGVHKKNFTHKFKKPVGKPDQPGSSEDSPRFQRKPRKDSATGKYIKPGDSKSTAGNELEDENIRLNRFIANAGICSRREADKLIEAGEIKVNGKLVKEVGTKVLRSDKVTYLGKPLRSEKMVYVLLNKPKGFITTMKDPKGRRTVMELVQNAGKERIYPVGRLDKDTTGLLLLTNDGDLTKRLTHPSHLVHKMYHVTAHQEITDADVQKIANGFELEDGFIKPDKVSRIINAGANELGIELHSGKNRIVRRMMEHLEYRVIKLDRVLFANLTKKDIPRGRWRYLNPKELGLLQRIAGKSNATED